MRRGDGAVARCARYSVPMILKFDIVDKFFAILNR